MLPFFYNSAYCDLHKLQFKSIVYQATHLKSNGVASDYQVIHMNILYQHKVQPVQNPNNNNTLS